MCASLEFFAAAAVQECRSDRCTDQEKRKSKRRLFSRRRFPGSRCWLDDPRRCCREGRSRRDDARDHGFFGLRRLIPSLCFWNERWGFVL